MKMTNNKFKQCCSLCAFYFWCDFGWKWIWTFCFGRLFFVSSILISFILYRVTKWHLFNIFNTVKILIFIYLLYASERRTQSFAIFFLANIVWILYIICVWNKLYMLELGYGTKFRHIITWNLNYLLFSLSSSCSPLFFFFIWQFRMQIICFWRHEFSLNSFINHEIPVGNTSFIKFFSLCSRDLADLLVSFLLFILMSEYHIVFKIRIGKKRTTREHLMPMTTVSGTFVSFFRYMPIMIMYGVHVIHHSFHGVHLNFQCSNICCCCWIARRIHFLRNVAQNELNLVHLFLKCLNISDCRIMAHCYVLLFFFVRSVNNVRKKWRVL